MLRRSIALSSVASALLVSACGSTPPVHLHTLLPPDYAAPSAAGTSVLFDPVSVPATVAQTQWLVRMPDGNLVQLENERWASPLPDELRAALAEGLRRKGLIDARSPGAPPPGWRARVEVTRFDLSSDGDARLEAIWAVTSLATNPSGAAAVADLRCNYSALENAGLGAPALADAQRRAAQRLADALAAAIAARARGQPASCG
jgi:uncharacterized lipoprotein YmbA